MWHEQFHDVVLVKLLGQCGPRWREFAGDRRQSREARPCLRALTERGEVHHNFLPATRDRRSLASVCYQSRRVSHWAARPVPNKRAGSEPDRAAPRRVMKVAGFPARRRACAKKTRGSEPDRAAPAPRRAMEVAGFPARRRRHVGTLSANLRGFPPGCVKAESAKRAGFPPQIAASEIYSSPEPADLIARTIGDVLPQHRCCCWIPRHDRASRHWTSRQKKCGRKTRRTCELRPRRGG